MFNNHIFLPFAFCFCSLQILPPYDPGVIHKGKVVRLGLNLNSDPIVSLGSKHTRTFINGARAPLCIIVVILILSTATTKQSCKQTGHTFKPGAKGTIAKVTATDTIYQLLILRFRRVDFTAANVERPIISDLCHLNNTNKF